jgi:hypothetical protein
MKLVKSDFEFQRQDQQYLLDIHYTINKFMLQQSSSLENAKNETKIKIA